LGIGNSSPSRKLEVTGSGDVYALVETTGTTGTVGLLFGDSASDSVGRIEYVHNSDVMQFTTGGSEQMRLTSTGLGIGTSSPSYKLSVNGDIAVLGQNTLRLQNSDNTNAYALQNAGASGGGNSYLSFVQTGVAERMRLDSSGNLGIGTSSPLTGLTLIKYGTQWTNHAVNTYPQPAGNTFLQMEAQPAQANWFGFTGTYGTTSGSANLLLQVTLNNLNQQAGNYVASEAQSAIASDLTFGKMIGGASLGSNSTKSEQMRLTSSGNLGIGTSSPAYKLDVRGDGFISSSLLIGSTSQPNSGEVRQLIANNAGGSAFLQFQNTTTATGCTIGTTGENFVVFTNTNTIGGGGGAYTERMRLDSSGNLGLGVTAPADKLEIGGSGAGIILASPNGTRYRITVSNIGVLTVAAV
jgi:hypothetical protein